MFTPSKDVHIAIQAYADFAASRGTTSTTPSVQATPVGMGPYPGYSVPGAYPGYGDPMNTPQGAYPDGMPPADPLANYLVA